MNPGSPLHLANLSWTEAAGILQSGPIGLLPIGAIEAHGPHLPLDTDVIIATATAEAAWRLLHDRAQAALVLPPVMYSVSFAGLPFAGTTPVTQDVFQAYLSDVLTHLARQGFRTIVCCNAHLEPAHVEAVSSACSHVEERSEIPVIFPDQRKAEHARYLGDEFQAGARHAGSYETSIVMAARPDAVRSELLESLEPVWIDLPAKLREGARTFRDAGSESGYFGDPRSASAEEGRRLLQALATIVIQSCIDAGAIDGA